MSDSQTNNIECHPLRPFLPPNARLLMLGSFPPPRKRWCMDFFYPNRTNMMWEIFGEVFFGDSRRLVDATNKTFRQADIEALLRERGIAIYDTATAVRRLSGNASDKDLQIVEKTDIPQLLSQIPLCHDLVCTGQKSFSVLTEDYGVPVPAIMEAYSVCQLQQILHQNPAPLAHALLLQGLPHEARRESLLLPPPDAGGGHHLGEFYKSIILLLAFGIAKSCKSRKLYALRLLRQQKFTRFTRFLPAGQGVIDL